MQPFVAFTKNNKGITNVLKTQVSITIDKDINPEDVKMKKDYTAIWDTGATNTVISESLAKKLKLTPISKGMVRTAGGTFEVNKYIINLILPNRLHIKNVIVTEGKLGEENDFLIGMDIITLGDFSITNVNHKTVFSFRYPSCKTINYVEETEKLHKKDLEKKYKNEERRIKTTGLCFCGSGKKYRYCHGKEQLEKIKKELEKMGS